MNQSSIPLIPLGEVLTQYKEYIDEPEPKIYPKLSVKLYGKGVVLDEPVDGTNLRMKRHQIAKTGQVILSEIWGKKGAIGFVPLEGNGALCTSHFFLFDVNTEKLDPQYLNLIFKANYLEDQLSADAKGTTGYAAVRPKKFLQATIPLSPIAEQRQIVARIEELAAKIEEARGLRESAIEEFGFLLSSELNKFINQELERKCEIRKIGDFTIFDRYGPRFYNESYSSDGIPIMRATDIDESGKVDYDSMPRMFVPDSEKEKLTLKKGDLAIVRSGSVGLAAVFNMDGFDCIPAAYLIQFRFDDSVVPEYVRYCLQAPIIKDELAGRGTALKNVNATKIKSIRIPTPSISKQKAVVIHLDDLQNRIGQMKRLRENALKEFDAILPAILDKAFKGEL